MKLLLRAGVVLLACAAIPAQAEDITTTKSIGMELARDLASEALKACRKNGYWVSAVVVDRHGLVRAVLRDDRAMRFTIETAEGKANAAVWSGLSSADFVKRRKDVRMELNHLDGVLMAAGGVVISNSGFRLGALGVSGAPGADKDEACARAAVKALEDRVAFAGE